MYIDISYYFAEHGWSGGELSVFNYQVFFSEFWA